MSRADDIKAFLEGTGKFKILEEILEGANAYSFRVEHTPLAKERFLKVYDYVEPSSMELLREPRVLAEIQKPPGSKNVVQLYDAEVIQVNGEGFLALQMEFVKGSSLLKLIGDSGIGQQSAIRIISGVLAGVSYLHSRRIVHRDLKPANVLIAGAVPKLTDFGSVALIPENETAISASKHSPLYVPPESSGSVPKYSFLSDIYQVGMLMYELINGPLNYDLQHYITKSVRRSLPTTFDKLDDFAKSAAAKQGIRELAVKGALLTHGRDSVAYLSRKARIIINKATNPNPEKRYQTAQAFLAAVNQLNLPDWRKIGDGEYIAEDWRGWDWMINTEDLSVKKSQRGYDRFRRIPSQHFSTLAAAFNFVEAQS